MVSLKTSFKFVLVACTKYRCMFIYESVADSKVRFGQEAEGFTVVSQQRSEISSRQQEWVIRHRTTYSPATSTD